MGIKIRLLDLENQTREKRTVPKSLEVSGRTVEEAINKGLAELSLSRDQVDVELLSGGSRGVFGLGSAEAVVRLTEREMEPSTPMIAGPMAANPELSSVTMESPASSTATMPLDAAEVGKDALEHLLRGMGIRSQVVVRRDDSDDEGPEFVLDIVGADLGILIGRRGETLRDLEFVTRLIVTQKVNRAVRFAVDVEGYRARRERVLKELAKRMADRVRQNRAPITLEAMPPHERRIVHITLREHPTVKTQSIGEGDHRRVMILPK
jgi:spoIIIJ-associated protein